LFHAGHIGHLHQKVHATMGRTNLNRKEPSHALVVHIEPDSMTFNEAGGWKDFKGKEAPGRDHARVRKLLGTPEHLESLRRIGIMDHITGNVDRHGGNVVLKSDGSVIAIDHGRSFWAHRKHAFGREDTEEMVDGNGNDHEFGFMKAPGYATQDVTKYSELPEDSFAAAYGGTPTKETWNWWHDNKDAIAAKFQEHVRMLPDVEARPKMMAEFMHRYNLLNKLSEQNPALQNGSSVVTSGNEKTNLDLANMPYKTETR
jgi:hypothetical protein